MQMLPSYKYIYLLGLVVFAAQADSSPDPMELLDRYEQSVSGWSHNMSMSLSVTRAVKGDCNPEAFSAEPNRYHTQITRRGNDVDVTEQRVLNVPSLKLKDGYHLTTRNVVLGEHMSFESHFDQAPTEVRISSDNDASFVISHMEVSATLLGYEIGDAGHTIAELMRGPNSGLHMVGKEEVNGIECFVLEASSAYGKHKLWLDPEKGCSPLRIVIDKGPEDLLGKDTRLAEPPGKLPEGAKPKYPWEPIVRRTVAVDSIEYENRSGLWIPISSKDKVTNTYESGKEVTFVSSTTVDAFELNPDYSALGAFKLDVPDGTPVYYTDARKEIGIKYQWNSGKVLPTFDETVVSAMDAAVSDLSTKKDTRLVESSATDSHDVPASRTSSQNSGQGKMLSAVLIGVPVVVSVVCLTIYKRRKAHGSDK